MRSQTDDRFRAALQRAASARTASKPERKKSSKAPEMMLGLSAIALALLAFAANRPDLANQAFERVAVALLREPAPGVDMLATASIPQRGSEPQERLQSLPQAIGQSDGSIGARVDINMGEETLRGSL